MAEHRSHGSEAKQPVAEHVRGRLLLEIEISSGGIILGLILDNRRGLKEEVFHAESVLFI